MDRVFGSSSMPRVTLPLAGLFYGVQFVLSLVSTFLFHRHRHQETDFAKNVNLARNVLFLLATVQWVLFVAQTARIFDANYGETTSRLAIASFVLFLAQIAVANIIMVYRLWIVGSLRHRIIAIPSLSAALLGATGERLRGNLTEICGQIYASP
ncbi:hypothetical protein PHLGIDRAFT_276148 [Phlebiopsis gigantea 11061_1 CR5-6]|uniref:Uncharacterized protein n=1 Tax=Phlebiopsis gigantea (strain 11061_1 CR5-6) TaxID=745531 RepID=A0A0C3S140_PHLG1|nr:hypothetical protein PHLGIDRAFT_276148 [Phlebiopsis gigantea 11061_1 CR5-6]